MHIWITNIDTNITWIKISFLWILHICNMIGPSNLNYNHRIELIYHLVSTEHTCTLYIIVFHIMCVALFQHVPNITFNFKQVCLRINLLKHRISWMILQCVPTSWFMFSWGVDSTFNMMYLISNNIQNLSDKCFLNIVRNFIYYFPAQ